MKHLKRYVNLAINKDLFGIAEHPFQNIRLNIWRASGHLTPEELEELEKVAPKCNGRSDGRSICFLFSCYTGLRFSRYCKYTTG